MVLFNQCLQSKLYFSSNHVRMWDLVQKEGQALKNWCWRRLLRVLWTERRSNLSVLKEINPEYSLEGLILKLKFQYFEHLTWRADSLKKTMMLGDWRQKEKGPEEDEMDGITDSMDMNLSKLWEIRVATGLEKVSFHSNPKERQCQRMFKLCSNFVHNCTYLTC